MRVLDDWLLTAERVAVHLPSASAVVADLHLGYSEARQRGGEAVPRDALDEQLSGLRRVMEQHKTRRLIIAGDLLEDGRCRQALATFQEWLKAAPIELAVVPGNHDRRLLDGEDEEMLPSSIGDPQWIYPDGFTLGGWRVIHGDGPIPDGCVVHGHEHPCLRWSPKSRAVRPRFFGSRTAPYTIDGACYLVGPQRLILPAFSREAAGVNVLSVRRWRSYRCYVLAGERVLDLGELATLRTRLAAAPGR
ncbi:MAG TPA: metallophosphoesterase [Gemmataceae bacterium]|nr:metallophosphoesterase [Gemmataceae bacterium]